MLTIGLSIGYFLKIADKADRLYVASSSPALAITNCSILMTYIQFQRYIRCRYRFDCYFRHLKT